MTITRDNIIFNQRQFISLKFVYTLMLMDQQAQK